MEMSKIAVFKCRPETRLRAAISEIDILLSEKYKIQRKNFMVSNDGCTIYVQIKGDTLDLAQFIKDHPEIKILEDKALFDIIH